MTFLYKETAILNTLIFPKVDGFLSHLDQKIFGFQPSVRFSETFDSWYFSELFYFGYFSYYLLPLAAFLIIYLKIPQKIEEFSFILITSFLLYYFTFILIPAEGPQFYFPFPENTIEANGIFGNMVKLIQKNGEVPTAAFPSSHVGISWIVIFWLYQNFRKSVKYFLPFVVDELLGEKKATVKVLKSMDKWYGVTYKEDKPVVVAAIQKLKDDGLYPQKLWEEK